MHACVCVRVRACCHSPLHGNWSCISKGMTDDKGGIVVVIGTLCPVSGYSFHTPYSADLVKGLFKLD